MVSETITRRRLGADGRSAGSSEAAADGETKGFRCPHCKQVYGDPLYHGPVGHAPQELCFDCWASEWGSMLQVISRGGNWQQFDAALFLLCQGFSHQEAAQLIGVRRKTIYNWIRTLRRRPVLAPDWLTDRACRQEGVRR